MIAQADIAKLEIVSYPDPILRKTCRSIEAFGPHLDQLARRMWELMAEHKGVGLAAPQVGLAWRMFAWNVTGEPDDYQVCINPKLENMEGLTEGEEGCLSLEGVNIQVRRAQSVEMVGQSPDGTPFRLRGEDLPARVWQHETDHLYGRLLLDYISPADEIANRRAIKQLEDRYKRRKHGRSGRR